MSLSSFLWLTYFRILGDVFTDVSRLGINQKELLKLKLKGKDTCQRNDSSPLDLTKNTRSSGHSGHASDTSDTYHVVNDSQEFINGNISQWKNGEVDTLHANTPEDGVPTHQGLFVNTNFDENSPESLSFFDVWRYQDLPCFLLQLWIFHNSTCFN